MRRFLALLFFLGTTAAKADMLVVVDKNSPIKTLSEIEVSNIFLAKTNYLKPIGRITPFELKDDSGKYEFYNKISGKTPSQVNSYWMTLIFTGKGKPPKVVSNLEELLRELANNPGAIAYLPSERLTSQLRVVHTIP